MRCDWVNDKNAPVPCHVVNLDTGKVLSPCAMADDDTGKYERYDYDPITRKCGLDPTTGKVRIIRGKGRIEIRQGPPPKL